MPDFLETRDSDTPDRPAYRIIDGMNRAAFNFEACGDWSNAADAWERVARQAVAKANQMRAKSGHTKGMYALYDEPFREIPEN